MPARSSSSKVLTFAVSGMTCRSCEVLVERKLSAVPGVADVTAKLSSNSVKIKTKGTAAPSLGLLNDALKGTQYALAPVAQHSAEVSAAEHTKGLIYWLEIGLSLTLLLVLSRVLKNLGVLPAVQTVEGAVGYASIFLIGIAAASSSCLALVGGLLLSVSAKWAQAHPQASSWQKLQPLLLFNMGRLVGYALLGGLVGLLGMAFGLTTRITGILTFGLAVVMVILGLNILGILPKKYCSIPLPRALMRKIQGLSASNNPVMPMLLGALTFFVPCGFTQSMQLLALGSGSFVAGAMIMLVFSVGTLPALLGISVISSYVRGEVARWFMTLAGATTLLLGIANMQSGLLLLGIDPQDVMAKTFSHSQAQLVKDDPFVTIDANGRQIISMYVTEHGYEPKSFTIDGNKPTWIYAIAPNGVSGCASQLTIPSYNMKAAIKKGDNWLGPFTPAAGNTIAVTCSMGMYRADLHVRSS